MKTERRCDRDDKDGPIDSRDITSAVTHIRTNTLYIRSYSTLSARSSHSVHASSARQEHHHTFPQAMCLARAGSLGPG